MPVDTEHEQYKKYAPLWGKCRACIEGEDRVKAEGQRFLPEIDGQDAERYAAYKNRALFFNATDRTVEALLGFLFRKPPLLSPDDSDFFDSLSPTSATFDIFIKEISEEVISVGRVGVLCDVVGGVPSLLKYRAEDIINWRENMIVLREHIDVFGDDEFKPDDKIQYRVLDLFEGFYRQRVFQNKNDDDNIWIVVQEIFPTSNGLRLETRPGAEESVAFIPFILINKDDTGLAIEKPVLIDLVNVNLSHYRSYADIEQGRHYTSLPTPWVAGFDPSQTELKIGAGVAWVSENADAKAGFLEFTGQGLGSLEKALEGKEAMMAILGARILEAQKAAVEATDTHKIRNSGEQSILSKIAHTIDAGMTWIIKVCADWRKISSDDINVELNKDYAVTTVDAALVAAMFGALQGAAVSFDTWFYNLKKWEMIQPGQTLDDELNQIAARNPMTGGSEE